MTVMKKMIVILSALFLAFPLQAAPKKASVDPVARDKAIDAIEAFSVQMQRVDRNFGKTEERLALMIPVMKKRYAPTLWEDRFRFLYYALTESDRADLRKAPPKLLRGQKIEPDKLLELYIAEERSLAESAKAGEKKSDEKALTEKPSEQADSQAASMRLRQIDYERNIGKIGLVEAIGREYAVVTVYYPQVEALLKLMHERIDLLSRLNQGEISRGKFEMMLDEQRRHFAQYRNGK